MPTKQRAGRGADEFFAPRRVETDEDDLSEGERRRSGVDVEESES
jgi:hypothetical protein